MMKITIKANVLHGILFVALFACAAFYISNADIMKYISFSPLIIGIIIGMIYGNTLKKHMPEEWQPGIKFSSKKLLRLAIILYGFRLTIQNIMAVGSDAIILDIVVIAVTLIFGILLGKLFKMDSETALLTSTGSAICGAAAVLGMESVLNNQAHKTTIAVSTVVIFGTLSMFLYPVMYRSGLWHFTAQQWGLYTGATVHEVAHVVGASNPMGESVAGSAIIVKMIRVIFLAPVLLIFAIIIANRKRRLEGVSSKTSRITIPWFAIGFLLVIVFNSFNLVPHSIVNVINYIDTFLLTMAMTGLGMETQLKQFKEAGIKPFILASVIYGWLIFGGYFLVRYLPYLHR